MRQITGISGPGCSTCGTGDTSYVYDPLTNDLRSKIANGVTTEYGNYDANGNPGYMIEAKGTPEERRTDYEYHLNFFNKVTKILEPSVRAANPTAPCTENTDCRKTAYTYDTFGNRTAETITGYQPDGTPVTRSTTYQYNGPLHQLSQIDGPRVNVTDTTSFRYYADDPAEGGNRARLKEVEDASGILIRHGITYTPTGKVLLEYDANNVATVYEYYAGNDRLDRMGVPGANGLQYTQYSPTTRFKGTSSISER